MRTALVISGGWGSPDIEWSYSPLMDYKAEFDIYIFKKCSNGLNDILHNGRNMAKYAEKLRFTKSYDRVFLMGHSMGGLVARTAEVWSQRGDIDGLITVATPHYGTMLVNFAKWLPSKSAKQMSIGSRYLDTLNANPARCPVYSIACKYDQLVVPGRNAIYRGSKKVDVFNMEHIGPVFSRKVAQGVVDFIRGEQ